MGNDFSKEEKVAFETLLQGFDDALILSRFVSKYQTDGTSMERAGDIIWRPMPYVVPSYDGTDQTANFKPRTQLSVPARLGYSKSVPWIMDAKELRDALQEDRLGTAAKQRLASDVNVALTNVAALYGSLVVKLTTATGDYGDIALANSMMSSQGVIDSERYLGLNTKDYNGLASDLAKASRSFGNKKSEMAYERNYLGPIANFDTYSLEYTKWLPAAAGTGITMSTLDVAVNYYIPVATRVATTGEKSNVDNRWQTITVSSTTGIVAGDCFTVADQYACNHITKENTGELKTYRVVSVDTSTTMTITPPMITNQVSSGASEQYQNCIISTKAANSAITFLNTAAKNVNIFWQRESLEILPGRYAVPSDSGVKVMRGSLDNGLEIVMQKFYDINTMETKFRVDTLFGVTNKNTEMNGIILFGQT